MTKKKKIQSILLLILLVILGSVFAMLRGRPDEEGQEEEINILSLEAGQISSFSYLYNETALNLKKKDGEWNYAEDEQFELDQEKVQSALDCFKNLCAERIINDSGKDLGQYGLAEPSNEIILTIDNEEIIILIGDQNSHNGDYYLKLKDNNSVYTVSSAFVESFSKPLDDFQKTASEETDGQE